MSKVVFFTFAGREANMEMQKPYVTALLDANPDSELHLWDLTREVSDYHYLLRWASEDPRVTRMGQFHTGHPIRCMGAHRRGQMRCTCMIHKPPYEMPYRWYSSQFSADDDTVFVKFDDDVIWMDVDNFPEVLEFLETRPKAIASANVTNNVVCAKYDDELKPIIRTAHGVGGSLPEYDKDWWWLHTSYGFAKSCHLWLTEKIKTGLPVYPQKPPVRPRPGERVSINFIAMKYPTLRQISGMMRTDRLGDEGTVDAMLPWIISNFRVAHLTFGPQEKDRHDQVMQMRNLYSSDNLSKTNEGETR